MYLASVQGKEQSTPNLPVLQVHFSVVLDVASVISGFVLAHTQAVSHLAPILPLTHLSHVLAFAA